MTTDVAALATLDRAELEARVASILAEAKRRGADAAEVSASEDAGLSLNVRLGEIETLDHTAEGTHLVGRVPEHLAHQLVTANLSA